MKMMIIDDNRQVREGIRDSVHWNSMGIEKIVTAENGREGIEIFNDFLPDIVLVDVMMPEINGIDFLKLARKKKPDVKILMISGYSEFKYAVEAMKYGASGYELKPLKMQQLLLNVSKLADEIRLNQNKIQRQELHKQVYHEKLLSDILHGRCGDKKNQEQVLLSGYGINPHHHILLICARVDKRVRGMSEDILRLVEQMIKSALMGQNGTGMLIRENDRYFIYCKCTASILEQMEKQAGFAAVLKELNELIERTGITLSAGISKPHRIYQISDGFEEAVCAEDMNVMAGASTCRIFEKKPDSGLEEEIYKKQRPFLDTWENEKDRFVIEEKIWAFFQIPRKYQYYEENACLRSTAIVMERIRLYYAAMGCLEEEYVNQAFFERISKMDSLESCEQLCMNYMDRLEQYRQENQASNCSPMVQKVKEFVDRHYMEEITVGMMAEQIGKTPNYLSHIFKAECGISFSEYLNALRIRKAKEMLQNSDKMIYEVAEAVGYSSYVHFTQVFKKQEGCSPLQYRKMRKEQL